MRGFIAALAAALFLVAGAACAGESKYAIKATITNGDGEMLSGAYYQRRTFDDRHDCENFLAGGDADLAAALADLHERQVAFGPAAMATAACVDINAEVTAGAEFEL